MSRRWRFNIPRSGQVQGIRPLGRLALCDHRHAVQEQIQERLLQVSSENAVRNATSRCEFPFCSDGIDVYVVASTTGGTSSGAVADVGLMVRNIAKSTSIPNVDIHGVLLHGTGAIRSATDVQDANTVSTLKELKHLGTPGMGTPLGFDQDPNDRDAAPFDHSYFVHVGDSLNDLTVARKAAEVAGYLFLATTTSASFDFRAWRTATPIDKCQPGRLRLLGYSAQHADTYKAAFGESRSLCTLLLRKWCGAVGHSVPEQNQQIPVELTDTETLLTELNLTERTLPEHVLTVLRGDCGHQLEALAADINSRLTGLFSPATVTHRQTTDFLQEQLSRKDDTHEDRPTLHAIVSSLRTTLDTASGNAQRTIVTHLQDILNSPHRLEGARAAGHFATCVLQRTQAGCRSLLTEIEEAFASLANEAKADATFDADNGSVADAVQAFTKQYCVLLAYQAIYHCFLQHLEAVSACLQQFLKSQNVVQLNLESVASEISTTMVLSSAVPQPIIDAFDRHLRSSDALLVSSLASGDITVDDFSTRIVREATHFLMNASDKVDGPLHDTDRKTSRFPEGAWPLTRGSGGERRVLSLVPEGIDQNEWQEKLQQSFAECVVVRPEKVESISVVCEISQVSIDAVMAQLTHNNPHVTDVASRIHTRTDVDW